jgi:hypothetical protein
VEAAVHWTEITVDRGSCRSDVVALLGGPDLALDRSNVADHSVTKLASGGYYVEFCAFDSNTGTTTLQFQYLEEAEIRCIAVRSNECMSTNQWSGLFDASEANFAIRDGLITNNIVTYLVGTSGFTFIHCYFYRFELAIERPPSPEVTIVSSSAPEASDSMPILDPDDSGCGRFVSGNGFQVVDDGEAAPETVLSWTRPEGLGTFAAASALSLIPEQFPE